MSQNYRKHNQDVLKPLLWTQRPNERADANKIRLLRRCQRRNLDIGADRHSCSQHPKLSGTKFVPSCPKHPQIADTVADIIEPAVTEALDQHLALPVPLQISPTVARQHFVEQTNELRHFFSDKPIGCRYQDDSRSGVPLFSQVSQHMLIVRKRTSV